MSAKFATHVLLFGQDKWIMRNIENAYPHVDKIYVAHSPLPWAYNKSAREKYTDSFDLGLLAKSEFADKITVISGVWDTEEAQRNACVDQAIKDGMDYLIIHDADEFYFHENFKMIIEFIEKHPNFELYKIGWFCFWKSFNYILLGEDGKKLIGYPEFAINLKADVKFQSKRRPFTPRMAIKSAVIPADVGVCYHGSYVLTNEEVYQKINTWGHANDFDREKWYKEIWLKWTPQMKNLHLVSPAAWSQAVHFDGALPEVIKDLK